MGPTAYQGQHPGYLPARMFARRCGRPLPHAPTHLRHRHAPHPQLCESRARHRGQHQRLEGPPDTARACKSCINRDLLAEPRSRRAHHGIGNGRAWRPAQSRPIPAGCDLMPRKEYTIAKPVAHALFDGQESFAEVLFPETALAEEESFDFSTFGRYGHLQPHFAKAFYVYGFEKHPATRKAVYDALKRFFEFLDVHNAQGRIIEWPSDLTRDVFDGYRRWLLARQSQAGASVYYNTTRRIVNCLKRVARDQFTTCEFPRFNAGPGSMPRSGLTSAVMERIVAAACEEARCVWEIFQRGQQLVADARKRITFDELMNVPVAACAGDVGLLLLYICEVYGGVVPIGYCNQRNGKYDWRLIEAVAAHGGVNAVSRYLHATAGSLAPFLILIGDGTWANAAALLHFRRDCMRADEVFPFRVSV